MLSEFTLNLMNISKKDLKNVVAVLNVGNVYELVNGNINGIEESVDLYKNNILYKKEEGKIYFYIGNLEREETLGISAQLMGR